MSTLRSPPNESLRGVKRCIEASLRVLLSHGLGVSPLAVIMSNLGETPSIAVSSYPGGFSSDCLQRTMFDV
jgi:hypothetical protein